MSHRWSEKKTSTFAGLGHGLGRLFISAVLVSQGCRNELSQTGWLIPIHVCSLTVLEARSSKSRYQQGHALSKGSRGERFLASSGVWRLLGSLGIAWLVVAALQCLPPSSRGLLPV